MRAEIVSVGTELLLGQITDTNASYLAAELPALGIDLYYISQVGDNVGRLSEAFRRGLERSDLIITTGGLGPTDDDLTREAIAATLGEKPYVNAALEAELRAFFARRGYPMPERNVKQAWLIPSARAIRNARGTAPGWWVEREGKVIVSMPGVPSEMHHMWEVEVVPRLRKLATGAIIVSRTLKTLGIGEGTVDEMMSPLSASLNPTLAVYAKQDGVHIRITAKASGASQAEALIGPMEERLRAIFGDAIWGVDGDTIESVIGRLLQARGLILATLESGTGGLIASIITDARGSGAYYSGGGILYSAGARAAWGLAEDVFERYGDTSPEAAQSLADAARRVFNATAAIGSAGLGSGPGQGKPEQVLYVAAVAGERNSVRSVMYPAGRPDIKRRAAYFALNELRRLLLGV